MSDAFTRTDIERIAQLARLELTDDEQVALTGQLGSFLEYARQVQDIDTTDVPPTCHPLGTLRVWREDEAAPSLPTGEALSQAPDGDPRAGLFKVPRVIG